MFNTIKDWIQLKQANSEANKKHKFTGFKFNDIEHHKRYEKDKEQLKNWHKIITDWSTHDELWICHMWPEFSKVGPKWCAENCIGKFKFGSTQPAGITDNCVYFELEEDAAAFKLRFC